MIDGGICLTQLVAGHTQHVVYVCIAAIQFEGAFKGRKRFARIARLHQCLATRYQLRRPGFFGRYTGLFRLQASFFSVHDKSGVSRVPKGTDRRMLLTES